MVEQAGVRATMAGDDGWHLWPPVGADLQASDIALSRLAGLDGGARSGRV